MKNEKVNHLKHGVLLLIASQDELNLLAEVVEIVEDCLHINEDYIAYMDEVLMIIPLSQIDESHQFYRVKPRKFSSWYRKVNSEK